MQQLPLIVNLRGTTGSGKTFVAKTLVDGYEDAKQGHGVAPHYIIRNHKLTGRDLVVLGHYGESQTGGCDAMRSMDMVEATLFLVTKEYPGVDIFFEGMLVSHTFGRWFDAFELLKKQYETRILFLNTPLEVCRQRAIARRKISYGEEANPAKLEAMEKDWYQNRRVQEKFEKTEYHSDYVDYKKSVETILQHLRRER